MTIAGVSWIAALEDGVVKEVELHPEDAGLPVHPFEDILGGTPVFVGTRVPVQSLFDHLEAGDSIDDFLEGFPSVRRDQVVAVLEASRKELLQPA